MSDLAFLTAQQEVAGQIGVDYTDTGTLARLKRWLNLAYDDVVGFYKWSWLKDRETVTMVTDYTTGTVSVAVAGTTATFSAVIAVSKTGQFIQFSSAKDWYKITAHTAGEATATISPAYAPTTALVSGTYTIRKVLYSLSSTCEYVIDCRQAVTNMKLSIFNARDYDEMGFPDDTGTPKGIIPWGIDSSNYWTFTPFPIPDEPLLLEFRIIKKNTALSGNNDTTIMPRRFDSVWLDRAKMYGYEFLSNSDMYGAMFSKTEKVLKELKGNDSVTPDEPVVMEMVDGGGKGAPGFIRFPDDYAR